MSEKEGHVHGSLKTLAVGAIGVVFGDIGTSPLYTLKECLSGHDGAAPTEGAVLGVLSLIVWALTLVVTVKYLLFIMRANNHGEGGIFALLALLPEKVRTTSNGGTGFIAALVIAGAALLYGDGMITPAISVLSAVEGIGVAVPPNTIVNVGFTAFELKSIFVPVTCVILFFLFFIQKQGTKSVGAFFGPVMVAWFFAIGALGAWHITKNPVVLNALNPVHAARFFQVHGFAGVAILGSVVLAVTGGEALYADMGHFGAKPIRLAWLVLVFPALALSYLGQGALVLSDPKAIDNPFFAMSPNVWFTYGLVLLATLATIIASQALISGAFSLTHQAVQLGFFPRVTIKHTASDAEGQIYVPEINWLLAIVCLLLVIGFKESGRLAAAYGIAVTGTMGITSIAFFSVTRNVYKWPLPASLAVTGLFLAFDIPFFGSNLLKFVDGGYVPIAVGAAFFVAMLVWKRGRRLLHIVNRNRMSPTDAFMARLSSNEDPKGVAAEKAKAGATEKAKSAAENAPIGADGMISRAKGVGVFMSSNAEGVPPSLVQLAGHLHVVPEKIVLLTIHTEHVPEIEDAERTKAEDLGKGVFRVEAAYGFMEKPDVPHLLAGAIKRHGFDLKIDDATYYLGRETFLAGPEGEMGVVTESIFAFLARNAPPATTYFRVPPERVVELGSQIDL